MRDIEISQIRENANSLNVLNMGYALYKQKKFSNYSFKINTVRGLTYEATANFGEYQASLSVGKRVVGGCNCKGGKLCEHEVCLFFLIKDELNIVAADKNLLEEYERKNRIDRILTSFIDFATKKPLRYQITPIIDIKQNNALSFILKYKNEQIKINDSVKFLARFENNETASYAGTLITHDLDYFDATSRNLISYLLNNNNPSSKLSRLTLEDIQLEYLFLLYLNQKIMFTQNYVDREYKITSEMPEFDFHYENQVLSTNQLNAQIIKARGKYGLLTNHFFHFPQNEKDNQTIFLYFILEKNNYFIRFNDETETSFFLNIYDSLENYISIPKKEPIKKAYNKIYLQYDGKKLCLSFETYVVNHAKEETLYQDTPPLCTINLVNFLETIGFNKDNNFSLMKKDDINEFLAVHLEKLHSYGQIYMEESLEKIRVRNTNSLSFKTNFNNQFLEIFFDNLEYSYDDLIKIVQGFKEQKKYINLGNDDIVVLEEENLINLSLFMDEIKDYELEKKMVKVPLYKAIYLNQLGNNLIEEDKHLNNFSQEMLEYDNANITMNKDLEHVLRDYQKTGVKWLSVLAKYHLGGVLADDMGLGKTIEVITAIDTMKNNQPSIIIAPTSLVFNWEDEFKKFAPWLSYSVIYGAAATREEQIKNAPQGTIFITSYETFRMDLVWYKDKKYQFIVVDEAQFIKNPDAKKSIAVKEIAGDVHYALTGTPIENSLLDLWSIFDFILPDYLGDKKSFFEKYSNDNIFDLSKKISPFILRRMKDKVLTLEPKIENFAYAVMSKEERMSYEAFLLKGQQQLVQENYKVSIVLNLLMRLRQFASEPRMFMEDYHNTNSKMDLLEEIIEEKIADNHRILVFSQFTKVFPFMEERLKRKGIKYFVLTGSTSIDQRKELVASFNSDETVKVFLISLKAGGTGLNLTGADTVVHYDPWWNLAAMNQATDRAYRIGQEKSVHVIKLIMKGTIEDKIVELQNKKKALSDSLINEESFVKNLSKNELLNLFKI